MKTLILCLGKDHWLGLDKIYKLTNHKDTKMQLKIDFETSHGGWNISVMYDDFSLADQVITAMNHT